MENADLNAVNTEDIEIQPKSNYEKYIKDRFKNDPEFRKRRYASVNKYVRARKLVDPAFREMFKEAARKFYQENREQIRLNNLQNAEENKAYSKKYYHENEEYRKKKIAAALKRYYDKKALNASNPSVEEN